MSIVTRRGFLSLLISTPVLLAIPQAAERIIVSPGKPYGLGFGVRVERWVLGLNGGRLVAPCEVVELSTIVSKAFRPDRLMMSCGGFNLLHLNASGVAMIGEGEVPSDYFVFDPTNYQPQLMFGSLNPGEEIVIAAVNRNKEPKYFNVSIMGAAMSQDQEPADANDVDCCLICGAPVEHKHDELCITCLDKGLTLDDDEENELGQFLKG